MNILDHGAKGDGIADDTAAIQFAIDATHVLGGGDVIIPSTNAFYRITKPLVMRSKTNIVGEGVASHIYNDNPRTLSVAWSHNVFACGSFARQDLYLIPRYALNDIVVGENAVSLKDSPYSEYLRPGEVIVILSDRNLGDQAKGPHYTYVAFNRILKIDYTRGLLNLAYPVDKTIDRAYLCQWRGLEPLPVGTPRFVWDRGSISNISVSTNKSGWIQRTAMFECQIKNVYVHRGDSLIVGNGFSHCMIDDVRGYFGRIPLSMAVGSSHTVVKNLTGSHDGTQGLSDDAGAIINMHERCRHVNVSDCNFQFPSMTDGEGATSIRIDGQFVTVKDCNIHARDSNVGIDIASDDEASFNVVSGSTIVSNGSGSFIRFPGDVSNSFSNTVKDCKFFGRKKRFAVHSQSGVNNSIVDCFFESGRSKIEFPTENLQIERCVFNETQIDRA